MELGQLVVQPLDPKQHTHTVIFLHGRGDTSSSAAEALLRRARDTRRRRPLVDVFPTVRWVMPQAPEAAAARRSGSETESEPDESDGSSSSSAADGRGSANGITPTSRWFDVWNVLDMSDMEELQAPGLRDSVASVRRLVDAEAGKVGGLRRVLLSGVGQGGAAAVHTLLHLGGVGLTEEEEAKDDDDDSDEDEEEDDDEDDDDDVAQIVSRQKKKQPARLCGLVCLSCWLPFPGGSLEETREVIGLATDYDDDEDPNNDDIFYDASSHDNNPAKREENAAAADRRQRRLRRRQRRGDEIVRSTPALVGHCADDPLVFPEYGRQLRDALRGFGAADVRWAEYPDGGHWLSTRRGVDDVVDFLASQGVPVAE
ncbi:alpha/beta-hydrolase [Hypoxylon sp. FL1284]|nr:alpha/beta-hydrolase [Hypoxylon sp. FL1284]